MLFFPIKLFRDQWSLFVAVSLPYFGTKGCKVPMLYYFDRSGSYGNHADVLHRSNKIQHLLNLLWHQKLSSKVDKFDNPFNKRSLPLKCFKGETIVFLFIWEFFKFQKNSWYPVRPAHLGIFHILKNFLIPFNFSSRSSGNFSNSEKFLGSLVLNHWIFQ